LVKTLVMFPGQGSQFVGMGKELLDNFAVAKLAFEEAEDSAKINIRQLCLDGPEDELKLTANTQPCILTHSVALWRVLKEETDFSPDLFAGHSLGEYSALVAAGILDLGQAAMLVRKRGEAMQEAVPAGVGAMAAVMNVPAVDLIARCESVSDDQARVEVVNFNSPQQLVVAGHKTSVDALCAGLEKDGMRFVPLAVSAPFHSSLMAPARDAMTELLEGTTYKAGSPVIANLTGEIEEAYRAEFLIKQINSPVLWTQSLEAAHSAGCEAYVECGPGKVLFGLARKSLPKGLKLINSADITKCIEDVKSL
jgi:[acyl-carrier-protein] S-malonyltransferase